MTTFMDYIHSPKDEQIASLYHTLQGLPSSFALHVGLECHRQHYMRLYPDLVVVVDKLAFKNDSGFFFMELSTTQV